MKRHVSLLLCLLLFTLLSCDTSLCEYNVGYTIEIGLDGSAEWAIEESFLTGESVPPSSQLFETFIQNVTALIESAQIKTGREMDAHGFAMTANVSGSYTVATYIFVWPGFAVVENDSMRMGDVFEVEGVFLYSEGMVNIVFPSGYAIESVSPQPHDQSSQTLTWLGIQDFGLGEPEVVLTRKGTSNILDLIRDNPTVIAGLVVAIAICAITPSLYYHKRKKNAERKRQSVERPDIPKIEDDEEKIVRILKTADGHLRQSTIAASCKFSKAKVSILLKKMEDEGKVKRFERGREKIVTLIDKGKGEGDIESQT